MNWSNFNKGDTILVHSSIRRTCHEHGVTPTDIIDSMLEAVGWRGTLLFPVFNFDFCHDVPFSFNDTPSQMGALSETARKFNGAVRSGNPIYGFVAIGLNQQFFDIDNYLTLGTGCPFDRLRWLDGKIAAIDVDDDHCMSIDHYIEDMNNAPNRFHKAFAAPYADRFGNTEVKKYECYMRFDDVQTNVNPAMEIMWDEGLYTGNRPMIGDGMRMIRARDIFNRVSKIIRDDKSEGLLWHRKEPGTYDPKSKELLPPTNAEKHAELIKEGVDVEEG